MMHFTGMLSAILLMSCLCGAQPAETSGPATLDAVAFMSGRWSGQVGGGLAEEHWSAPAGDNMVGMYRYVRNGKATMYEILLIEQTSGGPVLRLRHFKPGLVGWEDKEGTLSFRLMKHAPDFAVFEQDNLQTRITYRKDGPDKLIATLEKKDKKSQDFVMARMK